ncbi:MAG: hypothetical protein ACOCQ4_02265 [bacterium]
MSQEKNVSLFLTIPKSYRDLLRKQAAEANLENPEHVVSAASLATRYVCEYLDNYIEKHDKQN